MVVFTMGVCWATRRWGRAKMHTLRHHQPHDYEKERELRLLAKEKINEI